ncbi:hypothetical protein A2U01_0078149, partial [Trifolium medium]|nr:hypothetical protein [Trifolium medium]
MCRLNGDKVLEPIITETQHGISLQHDPHQSIEAEVPRGPQETLACCTLDDSLRKTVASNSVPIRRKRNLSCPPGGGRSTI